MKKNVFETIVESLSVAERTALLNRMQSAGKSDPVPLESTTGKLSTISDNTSTEDKFKAEPLILRLWLYIKALFNNTRVTELYNEHRLRGVAGKVDRLYPRILDLKTMTFGDRMYEKVYSLKKSSDFFLDSLSCIERDQGGFYMFLGTFFVPELSERFDAEINPAKIPLPAKLSTDTKIHLHRRLDDLLASIDAEKKSGLYEMVQSIDWLVQFCTLPFVSFLNLFGNSNSVKVCAISETKTELNEFARILCNGKVIPKPLIEAVAVYTASEKFADGKNSEDSKRAQEEFVARAIPHLDYIKQFMDTVPIRALGVLVNHAIDWMPARPQGSEDWFFKFKTRWKKYLDSQWSRQVARKQKTETVETLKSAFDISTLPILPVRPWGTYWEGIVFEHEYTMGFITFFYQILYPEYEHVIKTLVIEGIFMNKENGVQLSETMHGFSTVALQLSSFLTNISDTGIYGSIFSKTSTSTNTHNQQKIIATMQKITADASALIKNFTNCIPLAIDILKGIVSESKNPNYSSISNLNLIQGSDNEEFKKRIMRARIGLEKFFELFGRIQTIPSDANIEETAGTEEIPYIGTDTIDELLFPKIEQVLNKR
jgi:hypothetical protein